MFEITEIIFFTCFLVYGVVFNLQHCRQEATLKEPRTQKVAAGVSWVCWFVFNFRFGLVIPMVGFKSHRLEWHVGGGHDLI